METSKDRLVQRLLDDIKSASRQVYFGTDGVFTCGLSPGRDRASCAYADPDIGP